MDVLKTMVARMDNIQSISSIPGVESARPKQVLDTAGRLFRETYFCSVAPLSILLSTEVKDKMPISSL